MGAALSLPALVALTPHQGGGGILGFTVALALVVVWAHRANVRRLMRGEEHRVGGGAPAERAS